MRSLRELPSLSEERNVEESKKEAAFENLTLSRRLMLQPSTGRVSIATVSSLALYVYSTRSFRTNQLRFHFSPRCFFLR